MRVGYENRRAARAVLIAAALLTACSPAPTPTPSPSPPVALLPPEITGVGAIPAGQTSLTGMSIRLTEAGADTILHGPGTIVITLTDANGATDTLSMTGAFEIVAPGSLGVTATLPASNVLLVEIVDSDTFNVEQVTISGLRLAVSPDAAPGDIRATITECTGSLAGCAADRELPSPGAVGAAT